MKRMLMAVAVLSLGAGALQADWGGPKGPPPSTGPGAGMPQPPQIGGPNTLVGLGDPSNGAAPDRYGLNPRLRRFFRIGGPNNPPQVPPSYYYPLMGYNQNGPAYNPTGYPPGSFGAQPQGTLVFPHQTFVRSPRDYFMLDLPQR
jgi:hypothetical protein